MPESSLMILSKRRENELHKSKLQFHFPQNEIEIEIAINNESRIGGMLLKLF